MYSTTIGNSLGLPLKVLICVLCIFTQINHDTIGQSAKARIIVTTDITNEPDDQESMVRLLAYANDYDIEGLIGSTGIWKLSDPATSVIQALHLGRVIE